MDFINYITELPPGFNVLAVLTAILVGVAKTGVSGMAILVVPLIAMVFPAKESVGALLPMLIAGDILAVIYYRQHAQWGQLVKLVPGVAVGMLVGGLFLGIRVLLRYGELRELAIGNALGAVLLCVVGLLAMFTALMLQAMKELMRTEVSRLTQVAEKYEPQKQDDTREGDTQ